MGYFVCLFCFVLFRIQNDVWFSSTRSNRDPTTRKWQETLGSVCFQYILFNGNDDGGVIEVGVMTMTTWSGSEDDDDDDDKQTNKYPTYHRYQILKGSP